MHSVSDTYASAIQHHVAGRLHDAELLYRQILAVEPCHAEALHLLGVIAYQAGRHDLAVQHIESAIRINGTNPEMHSNLGNAYFALGRADEAAASYRTAITLGPNLMSAHYNLGNVFLKQGRPADAVDCYQRALQLHPDDLCALMNLGNARRTQSNLTAAEACFRRIVDLSPGFAEAHRNLGNALADQARLAEAVDCYREAIRLKPADAANFVSMGDALKNDGNLAAAIDCYQQALQVDPASADAHFMLGMTLLLQGNWEAGWREYEWRLRTQDLRPPPFTQPRWDGAALHGSTILLNAEQGLGDTLQFARYAPLVQQRGGRVLLHCQPPLVPLLTGVAGVDGIVPRGQPLPPFDCYAHLLSLPGLFGSTPANVPSRAPYLRADPERFARWRAWLDQRPGRKVGVCWRGNPDHREDHKRSVPLAALAPLAETPGISLVSLQIGGGQEDLARDGERLRVLDPGLTPDEQGEAFQELAALLCGLDLVVSVDTAIVHLAGALGVSTWVALPYVPDWRWLLEREDTPWYPATRLFRQPRCGDWESVFSRMARALASVGENGAFAGEERP